MKTRRGILSLLLVLCFVFGLVPITAAAEETTEFVQTEWYIPQRMKIGDYTRELSSDPGVGDLITVGKISNLPEDIKVIYCRSNDNYRAHLGDIEDVVDRQATIKTDLTRMYEPGIKELDVTGMNELGEARGVYRIQYTVEEPVITTNAPESAQVGQSIQFSTELTNTSLENTAVAPYLNPENYTHYDEKVLGGIGYGCRSEDPVNACHEIAYLPKVEVVEGAELVEQSNQDYSNILNSSETLTFKGAGTVKLKITYQQIMTCGSCEGKWSADNTTLEADYRYSPEATVVINVGKAPVSVTDKETGVKLDAESGVVPEDTVMQVESIEAGEVFDTVKNALSDKADKIQAFDISLLSGGKEIQPNGKVKIMMPIPSGFDSDNLAVYYVADNGKAEKIEFTVSADKKSVIFETNHFSVYALTELKQQDTTDGINPPSKDTSGIGTPSKDTSGTGTPSNPKTGEMSNPGLWFVLTGVSAAGLGGALLLQKRRKIMSLLLVLCFGFGLVPITAAAEETTEFVQTEWYIPQRMKIGDYTREVSSDPGVGDLITVGKISNLPEDIKVIYCRSNDNYRAHLGDIVDVVDRQAMIKTNLTRMYEPGIKELDVTGGYGQGEYRIVHTIQYTVEEPVITTNAPESAQVGESIRFSTELTNTALKNTAVAPYLKPDNYFHYDANVLGGMGYGYQSDDPVKACHEIAYLPKVEVVEGAELVEQSNQDYSNILNSSETLTFKGVGTVKLKITYQQIMTCGECEGKWSADNTTLEADYRYSPEATVVINVGKAPVSVTDKETGVKLDAESGVVPEDTVMQVESIETGEVFDTVKNALSDKADKIQAFDISLLSGGKEIQPNGKVKIMMPIPSGFDSDNLAVYYVADNGKAEKMEFTVSADKKSVIFETNHFSVYALTELKQQDTTDGTTPPSKDTSGTGTPSKDTSGTGTPSNPKTGEMSNPGLWFVLTGVSAAGLGGVLLLQKRRRSKAE